MKKCIAVCLALFFSMGLASAQSAEKITEILKTNEMTYGQVAYLAASYQDFIEDDANDAEAIRALVEKDILPIDTKAETLIKLDEACYLLAKTTNMRGGLFYTLFKNARYSCKEFKAKGIIPATVDSRAPVTGRETLAILTACTKNDSVEE